MKKYRIPLTLTALLLLLCSCSTVQIQSQVDPLFVNHTVGRIIVMGSLDSAEINQSYEDEFVRQLIQKKVQATAAYPVLPPAGQQSKEELATALGTLGADSILFMRVLSSKENTQTSQMGGASNGYDDYHNYYMSTSTYTTTVTEYDLETSLYDVKTRQLVWVGRQTVNDSRSVKKNIQRSIRSVIKDLQKDELF